MTDLIATYLLHSTVILGATLLVLGLPGLRRAAIRDALLRAALVTSLLTPWGAHSPTPVALPLTHTQPEVAARSLSHPAAEVLASGTDSSTAATAIPAPQQEPARPAMRAHVLSAVASWALLLLTATAIVRFAAAAACARRVIQRATPIRHKREPGIRVLVTDDLDVPIAIGLRTVLLPVGLSAQLAPAELRAVLAHEIAHIERRDPVWNTLLSFAAHALAFQPLNLLAVRAWRRATEEICDARAQELADHPLVLPRALVKLARRRTTLAGIALGVASESHLARRVQALLNKTQTRATMRRLIVMALIPPSLGLLLPVVTSAQSAPPPEGLKVVIDAGHGGSDPGAEGLAREADVVLAVALHARRILAEHGVEVALTRPGSLSPDRAVDLAHRRGLIEIDTDAFISIHASAGASSSMRGIQTFVAPRRSHAPDGAANYDASLALARAVHRELVQVTGARDRGVTEQGWYVLQDSGVPAVLVDVGFVTHPDEGARLATTAYQEQLGRAIADAVLDFLQQP